MPNTHWLLPRVVLVLEVLLPVELLVLELELFVVPVLPLPVVVVAPNE
jgi:hypothetical protein